jgi:hypothetical protein
VSLHRRKSERVTTMAAEDLTVDLLRFGAGLVTLGLALILALGT